MIRYYPGSQLADGLTTQDTSALVRSRYPDSGDGTYSGWNYPSYRSCSSNGGDARVFTTSMDVFNGQSALSAYAKQQDAFTGQSALNAYSSFTDTFTGQSKLNAWQYSSDAFNGQGAINVYGKYADVVNGQSALNVYTLYADTFNGQSKLNTYVYLADVFGGQSKLNVYELQTDVFNGQSALAALEKYYAWAMNLTTGAVSKYDGLTFNSLSSGMGSDSSGVHLLSGSTDNGVAIPAFVESGKIKLADNDLRTRAVDAYLGVNGGALKLTVTDERTGANTYKLAATTQMQTSKANLGRGGKGKYWSVRIDNVLGSTASVDSISLNAETLSRCV